MNENLGWAWHVHHEQLLEPLTGSIEDRLQYIRENKPESEFALREHLLQPVQGEIPPQISEAWQSLIDAQWDYYVRLWLYTFISPNTQRAPEMLRHGARPVNIKTANKESVDAAYQEFQKLRQAYKDAIDSPTIHALHEQECPDCPWDGETIFSGRE